jgi:pRiA4b ORF-3-like protein
MLWNTPKLAFTKDHRRTLRALVVDENGPGTILRDFEALLGFVRGRDLTVSKAHQLPPLKVLPQINTLLSHPIEVRLKRPLLKSYPHIQGLYLLLRATGLGQIGGRPSKPVLVVDRQVDDAWSALNPAERYFTLLEAWLLRGRPQIVGERDRPLGSLHQFADSADLIHRAGAEGLPIAGNDAAAWFWHDAPGRMGFALLEMFGLLTVVPRPPQEGEGWVIDRVTRTPLGEAIFALLVETLFGDLDWAIEQAEASPSSLGALQPAFAPYVPQWQHNLALPSWTFREGKHVLNASLGRGLWRRIAIDAAAPLDALARAILDAYDFGDRDHLYRFSYHNRFGVTQSVQHPYMDDGPWTSEVRIGDVPLAVGQSMTYLFDFGDHWEFAVTLEQVEPAAKALPGPVLIDGQGDAPEQYPSWGAEA